MKKKVIKMMLSSMLIFLPVLTLFPSSLMAESKEIKEIEVVVKVSHEGFFDAEGGPLNNILKVPKESKVTILFEFVGTDSGEDTHEFALLFESGEEIYSDPISSQNKRSHIEFLSGKVGTQYEIYCIIGDCDGMDNLTDLVVYTV
ncbi:MAG: hypothetical protein ACE5J1_01855 [Nitrospiria bacterium]